MGFLKIGVSVKKRKYKSAIRLNNTNVPLYLEVEPRIFINLILNENILFSKNNINIVIAG